MCQGATRDTQLGPHSLHALCIYESSRVYGCTPMFCLVAVRFSKPIPKLGLQIESPSRNRVHAKLKRKCFCQALYFLQECTLPLPSANVYAISDLTLIPSGDYPRNFKSQPILFRRSHEELGSGNHYFDFTTVRDTVDFLFQPFCLTKTRFFGTAIYPIPLYAGGAQPQCLGNSRPHLDRRMSQTLPSPHLPTFRDPYHN